MVLYFNGLPIVFTGHGTLIAGTVAEQCDCRKGGDLDGEGFRADEAGVGRSGLYSKEVGGDQQGAKHPW